jgi:hypothetical protein
MPWISVMSIENAGISPESSTSLKTEWFGDLSMSYFASQNQLGGFQIEALGQRLTTTV